MFTDIAKQRNLDDQYNWIDESVQGYEAFFNISVPPRLQPWERIPTYSEEIVFAERPDHPRVHNADGTHEATFYSSLRSLKPGEVVFTNPDTTRMPLPDGDICITSVTADVVDESHRPVPLDEVYLHHWILLDKEHPNDGVCPGYLKYIFGVGSETRTTPYDFRPYNGKIYGWFTNQKKQHWTANIHVLRTVDVDPEQGGLKGCIECHGPNKWCPHEEGGFDCCPDKSFCPTVDRKTPAKQYYFRYKVQYIEQSAPNVEQGANYILDVSHPKCNIEYNIPTNPTGIHFQTVSATLPHDTMFMQMWGHIHIGGYNATLYHGSDTSAKPICTTEPIYGTKESEVGNEKGYVVAMSKCKFEKPYIIKKGEPLTLETVYNVGPHDERTWNTGYHDGAMGLWFMTGAPCKTPGCENEPNL
jgi:hypothetical protein